MCCFVLSFHCKPRRNSKKCSSRCWRAPPVRHPRRCLCPRQSPALQWAPQMSVSVPRKLHCCHCILFFLAMGLTMSCQRPGGWHRSRQRRDAINHACHWRRSMPLSCAQLHWYARVNCRWRGYPLHGLLACVPRSAYLSHFVSHCGSFSLSLSHRACPAGACQRCSERARFAAVRRGRTAARIGV